MIRSSARCEKVGLKKGPWTTEEDQKLRTYIEEHGHGSWRSLPSKAGLERCGKSCRLRWTNYLRPDIKRGKFSLQEEQTIIQLHALLGNRWSAIATHLTKRTDNEIKNYWNTHLKKKLTKMGIDPVTHKPKTDTLGSSQSKYAASISHMAQWESARLEAEARLGRESKPLFSNRYQLSQLGSLISPTNYQLFNNNKTWIPKMPPCLDVLKAWQSGWTTTKNFHANNPTLMRSFFNSNGTLESPTSTLNIPNTLGFDDLEIHKGNVRQSHMNIWISRSPITTEGGIQTNWDQKMGIPDIITYPTMDHDTYISESLRLPTIMESYTDEFVSGNEDRVNNLIGNNSIEEEEMVDDFGENKNYWDNMLNLVTLQSGSPLLL